MSEVKQDETQQPSSGLDVGSTTGEPLRPEDFYTEGSALVFTAAYHLRRGHCCNSNCRHCPYR